MLRLIGLMFIVSFANQSWAWERFGGYEEDRFEARFEIADDLSLTFLCPDKQKQLPAAIAYWHWQNNSAREIEFVVDDRLVYGIEMAHKNRFGENQFRADSPRTKILFNSIVDALRDGSELVINSPGKAPVPVDLKGSHSALEKCRA
ncbi:MAG: hypothetical protein COA37_22895 [Hoeflea sp.]|uniref:hypothetical protein n=1 Tax=Hoeflea sp. TaxID=1940281 RepID=UPI000C0D9AF7|nr:hypothetical protein [Hoeflea sp.]PHR17257.1 MAG: hypothetical protein COA37_22895 [Hoeflea sp.]